MEESVIYDNNKFCVIAKGSCHHSGTFTKCDIHDNGAAGHSAVILGGDCNPRFQ